MDLSQKFALLLKQHREIQGLSQEDLATRARLDRTFVSQLERGLKSPTLKTVEKLAAALALSPLALFEEIADRTSSYPEIATEYRIRDRRELPIARDRTPGVISTDLLVTAISFAHDLIDQLYTIDLDIAAVLGMRNLSGFIGELYSSSLLKAAGDLFRPNPHQDGYPDLLLMDELGKREWKKVADRIREKRPFSPFSGGGVEVKATCGSVPPPQRCLALGYGKPSIGDTRGAMLTGYDWKAHHRDTNNLVGILWDFIKQRPRIAALFYSADLQVEDWGEIIAPKAGGGRTTSVSIMTRTGIFKMHAGWVCVRKGPYAAFLNRKNKQAIIPES